MAGRGELEFFPDVILRMLPRRELPDDPAFLLCSFLNGNVIFRSDNYYVHISILYVYLCESKEGTFVSDSFPANQRKPFLIR